MNEEQLKAEVERLKTQQKNLENDWHALRGAIAAVENILAIMQKSSVSEPSENE